MAARIQQIVDGGVPAAVSVTPPNTKRLAPAIRDAGADILVVQSTVTTARHESRSLKGLILRDLVAELGIPVLVGNTVGYRAALELMEEGIAGLLVGVGPGAACTSREVLGIGVPQVTATIDCAAARDEFERRTGRRVPIITDGGIRTGGDVCKSFAAGADAVMIGSPFAGTQEAPGRGYHWGMATPHAELPRGVRVHVGRHTSLERLLNGPTSRTDGTENLAGALRTSMGSVGARNLVEMQRTEMIIAPCHQDRGQDLPAAARLAVWTSPHVCLSTQWRGRLGGDVTNVFSPNIPLLIASHSRILTPPSLDLTCLLLDVILLPALVSRARPRESAARVSWKGRGP